MSRRYTPQKFETAHLTVRCNNKEFLLNPAQHFSEIVSWVNSLPLFYKVELHHIIFMTNHMHLLVTPQNNNLGAAMCYFLANLTKYINYKLKRRNHVFGERYAATVVKDSQHFVNIIRYLYQNPIRAKMVDSVHDYKYSSLGFYSGKSNDGLMLSPDYYTKDIFSLGCDGQQEWLSWIESPLSFDDVELMRHSLTRSRFRISVQQFKKIQNKGTSLKL